MASRPPPRASVLHRQPSEVEDQLAAAVTAERVITLAGGVPADDLFPAAELDAAMAEVMRDEGAAALQYGYPAGFLPLRAWIAARLTDRGVPTRPEEVLVTSGAQQAIHLLGRLLVPEGAPLCVERPTYVSALQAFDLRRPAYHPVERTARGLDLPASERAFHAGARVLYLVATGHNPTGGVLSPDERRDVLALAERHDAWVLDDDAYGDIVYGPRPAPLRRFGRHLDRVVHVGSFSKVLAPGLRVGWIAGSRALVEEATRVKQAEDLETATLTQRVLARWLLDHDLDAHVSRCIGVYRERRDALVDALARELGRRVPAPEGGFSLLLELGGEARALLPRALEAGVAFEPAAPYFVGEGPTDVARLSFSNVAPAQLREAVRRLASVVTVPA